VPTVLLLVGDVLAMIDNLPQPRWRKKAIRWFWKWNCWEQNRIARSSLTFVNNRRLFEELQPYVPCLVETRTTTLNAADFFVRDDTCLKPPFRLLYTGRMDRGKGLLEMVEAVAALIAEGENVVLDLVGPPEKGDPVLQELAALAAKRNISERIRYHGYMSLQELFNYYKQADIYVIASKTSEGFPRTIWEAMAHSLPVVATGVGSIPQFVGEAAIIVKPNDCNALSGTISAVLHDGQRRREMIRKGRELAASVTLEKQVASMVRAVQDWLATDRAVSKGTPTKGLAPEMPARVIRPFRDG
jgi:glycosyltransferase involved in cell wall biosynthesis